MDKLRAIEGFVKIVDRGSLTAAAAELDVSLSTMVRTLAALERTLGTPLLARTTRRLRLTDEGRLYLEHCRAVLAHLHDGEAALRSRSVEPKGRIALTASVVFGCRYVTPIAIEFGRTHPEVAIDLLLVDRVVNLLDEGLDAAVRIGPLEDSSLVAIPVGRVRRVVCASPDYLRRAGTPRSPDDVRGHRCVRFTGLASRPAWTFSNRRNVGFASALTCNQAEAAIEACVRGFGLGFFLSYMVAPFVRDRKLRYVLEDAEPEPLPVHFVYPHARFRSAAMRAFSDACTAALRRTRLD
ncbi:MAG TPA: LysR family transcriptional regulator [Burkholderiaceae bacterium]|jgi:DNA-binding transcriptional LysR family regulator|nr:LysR family transcriptional regulator [Burkholderiaceae bacterium]